MDATRLASITLEAKAVHFSVIVAVESQTSGKLTSEESRKLYATRNELRLY